MADSGTIVDTNINADQIGGTPVPSSSAVDDKDVSETTKTGAPPPRDWEAEAKMWQGKYDQHIAKTASPNLARMLGVNAGSPSNGSAVTHPTQNAASQVTGAAPSPDPTDYATVDFIEKRMSSLERNLRESLGQAQNERALQSARTEVAMAIQEFLPNLDVNSAEAEELRTFLMIVDSSRAPIEEQVVTAKSYIAGLSAQRIMKQGVSKAQVAAQEKIKAGMLTAQPQAGLSPAAPPLTSDEKTLADIQLARKPHDVLKNIFG